MEKNQQKDLEKAVTAAVALLMKISDDMFPGDPVSSVSLLETAYAMQVKKHFGTDDEVRWTMVRAVSETFDFINELEEEERCPGSITSFPPSIPRGRYAG